MKKKLLIILIVIGLILSLSVGTALAKKDTSNGNGNGKGQSQVNENKKSDTDESTAKNNGKDKSNSSTDKLPKGKEKQELKNAFKQAVSPYLAKIKANKRAWGQAGGLDKLEGITDDIENALEKLLAGQIPVTDEQLAAIKAEIDKIKGYKATLQTDKSAQNAAWHSYIVAKKTYSTDAAIAALQKVIDLQLARIDARKGIFASMSNIFSIVKQALANPPAPAPEPSASASPSESPSSSPSSSPSESASPEVSPIASAA